MEVPQAIEKVLVFKGERAQMLGVNPDAVAQPVIVGNEKGLSRDSSKVPLIPANNEMCEETPVDVIRDEVKDDINPAILNKDTLDLEYDEMEEEKSKLFQRKRKKLSRKTVAELKQKVNLRASSNIILVLHLWCFKGEQDKQDKQGIEKPAWKLHDCIKQVGSMKMGQALRERDDQKTMKAKMWKRRRCKLRKSHTDYQKLGNSVSERRPCIKISILKETPSRALWD
ncbi:splicing factor 3B subunit 2 [Trichonephila clavata]|uniref:Splicing factor 3B subunit 2 n=1 Tax=Trichonephila clavata TaxID=2740835 RepID=A0A8X6HNE1_TRICU|nr:splicing factor 3B subunit 2 [Trichonephila clavata]